MIRLRRAPSAPSTTVSERCGSRAGLNPRDERILDDPLPAFDRMRQECPVAWSRFQHWSLFRHSEAVGYCMTRKHSPTPYPNIFPYPTAWIHQSTATTERSSEPYFSPDAMARFEPRCREIARDLVQSLPQSGSIDVIPGFAEDFALRIQCAFMGWRVTCTNHCVNGCTATWPPPSPVTVKPWPRWR